MWRRCSVRCTSRSARGALSPTLVACAAVLVSFPGGCIRGGHGATGSAIAAIAAGRGTARAAVATVARLTAGIRIAAVTAVATTASGARIATVAAVSAVLALAPGAAPPDPVAV